MSIQPALMPSVAAKSYDAFTINNGHGTVYALLPQAQLVTWQTSFGTNPAAINITIDTSIDNIAWNVSATTTTVGGAIGSFVTSAQFIRASIVSHTNGDTVTVNLVTKVGLLGIVDPSTVTDGSLVIYSGTSGDQFGELAFSGNATDALLGDGTFGNQFDQDLNTADDVAFSSVTSAFISSDTSAGISTTITTAGLVGKTITVKDGIITGFA